MSFAMTAAVMSQVCGNPKQIIATVRFALILHAHTKEPIIRFLKQVVGKLCVSGLAPEIDPQGTGRAFIECSKRILVHLKRIGRLTGCGLQSFDFRKRDVGSWGVQEDAAGGPPSASDPGR